MAGFTGQNSPTMFVEKRGAGDISRCLGFKISSDRHSSLTLDVRLVFSKTFFYYV
jgi:hypothetical protein